MAAAGWHRVFHPLCGSDPRTLLTLLVGSGGLSASGLGRAAIALMCVTGRLPFSLVERAWFESIGRHTRIEAPLFIVGHMRSGTTHLHNLLAATGHFATVPPVIAGMPWEALGLARMTRQFIEPYLPPDRLIDRVALHRESPTEDEIALASMTPLSYYHAIYFPRRFKELYARGLFFDGCSAREVRGWQRTMRHYVTKMARLDQHRPLLLKNPAYTARIGMLHAMWPEARFIHIHRDPLSLYLSTRRALRTIVAELALQEADERAIVEAVLEAYPRQMRCLREDAAKLPPGKLAHVGFEDLERDPHATLGQIYETLGLAGFAAAAPRISVYLDEVRSYRRSDEPARREDIETVEQRWRPVLAPSEVP